MGIFGWGMGNSLLLLLVLLIGTTPETRAVCGEA